MLRSRNCGVNTPNRPTSPKSDPETHDPCSVPNNSTSPTPKTVEEKFAECLFEGEVVDLDKLRRLSWNGIPEKQRPLCWKILMVREA